MISLYDKRQRNKDLRKKNIQENLCVKHDRIRFFKP